MGAFGKHTRHPNYHSLHCEIKSGTIHDAYEPIIGIYDNLFRLEAVLETAVKLAGNFLGGKVP